MDASAATAQGGTLSDDLAPERTPLAWIRTGLALMGFRFVVARFGLFLQQLHVSAARFLSTTLRSVAEVWNRTHRSWCRAESILRMASLSTNPGYGPGPRHATRPHTTTLAVLTCMFSGISRDRNGDLSDFSSRLCAFLFWN